MKKQPDNWSSDNHANCESFVPDRPVDFLDKLTHIQKIRSRPHQNEPMTYLLPEEDGSNSHIEVDARLMTIIEHNPFVRRLLTARNRPDRPTRRIGSNIQITKAAILMSMKELNIAPVEQDFVEISLAFAGLNQFISLNDFIDFCYYAGNLAIEKNNNQVFLGYQKLADKLRQKFAPRLDSNFIHLRRQDINNMNKKNINPLAADIKTIKKIINHQNNDQNDGESRDI